MSDAVHETLEIRRATAEDSEAIIELCKASLQWRPEDPNEQFFAWKHDENPVGVSPRWVAVAPDGSLAGLRVFLRWRYRDVDGQALEAVRAVDTATHPDWQGRGIFTKLTLGALPDLREDGIDFVFNTPNDKSRPGYLKMGWSEVGRVPVGVRLTSVRSPRAMTTARAAAELWSEPTDLGEPASVALADAASVQRLLSSVAPRGRIGTDRTPAFLHWRYRFAPLDYRVAQVGDTIEDGIVIFRLRRRGGALECAVCDVIVPEGGSARAALRRIARRSGADYLLRCAGLDGIGEGFIPAPQLGPILTWRPIRRTGVPRLSELALTLGDVELF